MSRKEHLIPSHVNLTTISRERSNLTFTNPVQTQRTGRRGRPRKVVDPVWLTDAVSDRRKLTIQAIADALGMHRNTLRNYLKIHGVYRRFTDISDSDLDILTTHFKRLKPNSGLRYLIGFLKVHGIKVQRQRVRHSLRRVDGLGQALRTHAALNRREYSVPRPNAMWHLDGHHKLIKWGIVVHGIIDGYDRMVTIHVILPSLATNSPLSGGRTEG